MKKFVVLLHSVGAVTICSILLVQEIMHFIRFLVSWTNLEDQFKESLLHHRLITRAVHPFDI